MGKLKKENIGDIIEKENKILKKYKSEMTLKDYKILSDKLDLLDTLEEVIFHALHQQNHIYLITRPLVDDDTRKKKIVNWIKKL